MAFSGTFALPPVRSWFLRSSCLWSVLVLYRCYEVVCLIAVAVALPRCVSHVLLLKSSCVCIISSILLLHQLVQDNTYQLLSRSSDIVHCNSGLPRPQKWLPASTFASQSLMKYSFSVISYSYQNLAVLSQGWDSLLMDRYSFPNTFSFGLTKILGFTWATFWLCSLCLPCFASL